MGSGSVSPPQAGTVQDLRGKRRGIDVRRALRSVALGLVVAALSGCATGGGPPPSASSRCASPKGLIVAAMSLAETPGQVISLICVDPTSGVGGQSSLFKVADTDHVAVHDLALHNPLLERSMFSADLAKVAAWESIQGAVHVGWVDTSGQFQDVSGPLQSGWPAGFSATTPQFQGGRYYFGLQADRRIVEVDSVPVDAPSQKPRVEKQFAASDAVADFAIAPDGTISSFDPSRPRWLRVADGYALNPSDLIGTSGYIARVVSGGTATITRHALVPQATMLQWQGQPIPGTTVQSGAALGDPVVSPDGQRYAFTRTDGAKVWLSTAPMQGGPATQVPAPQYSPSPFSRDATLIAWY
jgi:hypothetical protein